MSSACYNPSEQSAPNGDYIGGDSRSDRRIFSGLPLLIGEVGSCILVSARRRQPGWNSGSTRPPSGAGPILRQAMTAQGDGSFAFTVTVADLTAMGLQDAIYYGYRAWGPNWPFETAWTPGSGAGFVTDVDSAGNRFNPNKLLLDPYALEVSHDPLTPEPSRPDGVPVRSRSRAW